jgi:hypothetical protein
MVRARPPCGPAFPRRAHLIGAFVSASRCTLIWPALRAPNSFVSPYPARYTRPRPARVLHSRGSAEDVVAQAAFGQAAAAAAAARSPPAGAAAAGLGEAFFAAAENAGDTAVRNLLFLREKAAKEAAKGLFVAHCPAAALHWSAR